MRGRGRSLRPLDSPRSRNPTQQARVLGPCYKHSALMESTAADLAMCAVFSNVSGARSLTVPRRLCGHSAYAILHSLNPFYCPQKYIFLLNHLLV